LCVIVAAIVGDVILHRTRHGLGVRFVGLNPNAALRIGVRTRRIQFGSYIVAAVLSTVAGILLATQVGVGDPTVGSNYALISVAAAVLGGASLFGGRGSLVGAVWGALFLSLIVNVSAPLGWSASVGDISTGLLTLVAILLYSWGAIAVRRPEIRRFLARIIRSAPDPEGGAAE
jgi:ribose transport system ATP-binding protein